MIEAPELEAPEGFSALDGDSISQSRSFVSGDPDGRRVRVRYFWNDTERRFIARVWFGELTEGPPGHVHGGCVAAVLDESMGTASWCSGHPALAAKIEVEFKAMVPIGTVATVSAWLGGVDDRKVTIGARLEGDDGKVFSESTGLFIEQTPEQFGRYADFARMAKANRKKEQS
jgi:acyl-coenzyme A thioesterase PaaI-like protein